MREPGSYAVFATYVAWLRVQGGPLATCGCFGAADAAPTWTHVALDVVFVVAAASAGTSMHDWLPVLLAAHHRQIIRLAACSFARATPRLPPGRAALADTEGL